MGLDEVSSVNVAPGHWSMSVAIGVLSGLLVAAAALVIGIVPWFELLPALVGVVAVLGLAYTYLGSLSESALGGRGRLAAALALVGFAPVIGHAAQRSLHTPLSATSSPGIADAGAFVLLALACLSAASAVGWWWACRRRAPRGRMMHYLALATMASCAGLVTAAAADAQRTPSPESYASTLPVVSELLGGASAGFSEVRPTRDQVGPGGFALGRTCLAGKCFAHVRLHDRVQPIGPLLAQDARLALHLDEVAGVVVLAADGVAVASMGAALTGWEWIVPSAASMASQLSPPRSFIALAALALLGALLVLAWRRRLSLRLNVMSEARVGTIDASGWAHLDDGTPPWRVRGDIAHGPVVMVVHDEPPMSAYRGDRRRRRVSIHRGPRRAAVARLRLAVATADAAICSWVVALSAPLVAAALLGLLG